MYIVRLDHLNQKSFLRSIRSKRCCIKTTLYKIIYGRVSKVALVKMLGPNCSENLENSGVDKDDGLL